MTIPEPEPEPAARESVYYPRGACTTGWIEVQIFEPGSGWVPHPEHPRVRAGEIHTEPALQLLDLRVRCIDPDGDGVPSDWVRGVDLDARPAPPDASRPGPS